MERYGRMSEQITQAAQGKAAAAEGREEDQQVCHSGKTFSTAELPRYRVMAVAASLVLVVNVVLVLVVNVVLVLVLVVNMVPIGGKCGAS